MLSKEERRRVACHEMGHVLVAASLRGVDPVAKALIVVAPPKTLAELRNAFHPDVKAYIVAEINKDLTRHPLGEIEKQLMNEA